MGKYTVLFLLITTSSFVHHKEIGIEHNSFTNAEALHGFYTKLVALENNTKGTVSIVHIGDSHIQAGFFTGVVRKNLQGKFGNAGRGFVFPYKIANTHGALDIRFRYTGAWQSCNIMKNAASCNIGAAGFTVTASPNASFTLDATSKTDGTAHFNKVTLLDNYGSFLPINARGNFSSQKLDRHTVIYFDECQDSLLFKPAYEQRGMPELQGLILGNGQNGILYHAMGINGSSTVQYLKSLGFENQIRDINADLVILSFGTNDTYMPTSSFCATCVKERYAAIIDRIRAANPDLPILLTTPADHYYLRKYSNKNLKSLIDAMYELCCEKNIALWDLNAVMGGPNSIVTWRNQGWARGDLIHFTEAGYQKQGDMLYDAIMHHYQSQ